MRTMKKVIALSLVLAMALSMMATAAFKDQEAINEDLTGDISLMVALNVFSEQGTGAGYFEPNRELTREEVAKLIYVLKNKGNDNGATSWTGMNIFKDIEAGRWSEGYINYAASVGMMAGTGEGYFNPTAKMSAVEVAKLLLVLNGYKADVQGYLGTNWDVNIIRDAEAAGIFANYELPVRGSVTREWVARLMNNGIYATKVKYEDGQAVEQYNILSKEPVTFATQDLGMKVKTGVLIATANAKLGVGAKDSGYCELDTDGKYNTAEYEFKCDIPLNLLGQKVTVISKGDLTNDASDDIKVYGVSTAKDNVVTTTTIDEVKWDSGKKFESDFKLRVDYVNVEFTGAEFFGVNDGRTITLVDYNNNGKYDAGFVKGVEYGKVDYANPSRHIIRIPGTSLANVSTESAYEKITFEDSVAKGDVVKLTKDYSTGENITIVQKVDVVAGAVTKLTSDGVATIDGSEYKLSDNAIDGTVVKVDKTAKNYYVDGKYVVFSDVISTETPSQTNIAYVIKAAVTKDAWQEDVSKVDILKNDGTREVLEYKEYSEPDDKPEGYLDFADGLKEGKLVEYVMSGGKVYFKDIDSKDKAIKIVPDASGYEFKKSTGKLEGTGKTTLLTNEDSYFFVVGEDSYAVLTASELKGNTAAAAAEMVYSASGLPYVKYGVLVDDFTSDSSTGYGIAARSQATTIVDDEEITELVITKMDGTEVTVTTDNKTGFDNDVLGKFVSYEIGTDGHATVTEKDPSDWYAEKGTTDKYNNYVLGALTHAEGNAVMIATDGTIANAKYFALADDAKIYYVDAYKSSGNNRVIVSEGDGLVTSIENDGGTTAQKSVYYRLNEDLEISHIIVEIHGETIWTNNEIQDVQ